MRAKGDISVREAGRGGGNSTRKRCGGECYQPVGRKGGETTKERHGPEHYARMGRMGGATVTQVVAKAKRARKG